MLKVFHITAMLSITALLIPAVAVAEDAESGPTKLAVIWSSADPDVANGMCLMYTHAAKAFGWFDEVRLVIWGPSQKLVVEDAEIQAKVKEMQKAGIIIEVCVYCAKKFGVDKDLEALGYDVKGMGQPLTHYLKSDEYAVLTF